MNLKFFKDLNLALFKELNLICKELAKNSDSLELSLLSQCGAVTLEIEGKMQDVSQLVETIKKSQAYELGLKDRNYGRFSKSDLFLKIINSIIIPTQLENGPALVSSNESMQINGEEFFVTTIVDKVANNNFLIDHIRAEIPSSDECFLWDDQVDFFKNVSTIELEDAVRILFNCYREQVGNENNLIKLKLDLNAHYLEKPRSISSLYKFFNYIGVINGENI